MDVILAKELELEMIHVDFIMTEEAKELKVVEQPLYELKYGIRGLRVNNWQILWPLYQTGYDLRSLSPML